MVTKGVNKITTGYTIELYQVNSISSQTRLTTANHEIVALSLTGLTMDLRLIEKGDYLLLRCRWKRRLQDSNFPSIVFIQIYVHTGKSGFHQS